MTQFFDFTNKVVVITGAGGVICGELAKSFGKQGAKVALLDLNEEAAQKFADEIIAEGGIAKAYKTNVLEKDSLEAVREAVNNDLGTVDVLVNGAGGNNPRATTDNEFHEVGLSAETKTFFDLDKAGIEFVFNLNYLGTLLPTQVFAQDMVGKEGANIINISSMNAFTPLTKIPAYSGAKAAISNFTQWLAVHFSKVGIRCNAIAPGFLVTAQNERLLFDEQGNPTPKYFAVQKMMETYYPEYLQMKPLTKESFELRDIALSEKVSLFETLADLAQPVESLYPVKMEDLGQSYGYLLYRTEASWDADEEKIRVIDGRDRMQLFVDGKLMATQYQAEIGQDIFVAGEKKATHRIDILMENMGRVNYGHKFLADTQRKGIRTGVCKDLHFLLNWQQYPLSFENTENIDFSKGWQPEQPAFYAFDFKMKALKDTYLDLSGFGKGLAFVNGVNIGRFWNVGPTLSLYIPHSLLKEGHNRIIIFETEGEYEESINLVNQPTFKTIKGENL